MAQQATPVRFVTHLQLHDVGVSVENLGLNNLTMDSDRFVCVRGKIGQKGQVSVVDVYDPRNVVKRSISADSAIMNPTNTIIALRDGKTLQIFNLETNTKLKACIMEDVEFWTWISDTTVAIVTKQSVYHWTLEGTAQPMKVFDRDSSLNGHVILKYETDEALHWSVMTAITKKNNLIFGRMQLFCFEDETSYAMDGYASAFAQFHVTGNRHPSLLICYAVRDAEIQGWKLYIKELGRPPVGNKVYQIKEGVIHFPPDQHSDIPVAMEVSSKHDVILLLTINGYVHMFDLETGVSIYTSRVSHDKVIASALYQPTTGIICVNRRGQVTSVSVDEDNFIAYIKNVLRNRFLALRIASRNNLSGAEDLFYSRFDDLFKNGNYCEAAKVAASAAKMILRTAVIIQRFQAASEQPGPAQNSPIVQYFDAVMDHGKLNKLESLELCRRALKDGRPQLIEKWVRDDKLGCSEELSELIKPVDLNLSMIVYERAIVDSESEPLPHHQNHHTPQTNQRSPQQLYSQSQQRSPQQLYSQSQQRSPQQSYSQSQQRSPQQLYSQSQQRSPQQLSSQQSMSPMKTRALYDYKGTSQRDLIFKQGDVICDVTEVDANWYRGTLHGRSGIFPKNYVEVVPVKTKAPPPLPSSPPAAQPSPSRSTSQPPVRGGSTHGNVAPVSDTGRSSQPSVNDKPATPFHQLMNEYKASIKRPGGEGST